MAERTEAQEAGFFQYERGEDGTHRFYVRPNKLDLMPGETREHFRAAGKEFLLAIRTLVDAAIQRQEKDESKAAGPRKIEVT